MTDVCRINHLIKEFIKERVRVEVDTIEKTCFYGESTKSVCVKLLVDDEVVYESTSYW